MKMTKDRELSYKETKDRPCVICGTITTVTKFMSDKVVRCGDCKSSGRQPDGSVVIENTNHRQRVRVTEPGSNTKPSKCIQCGADIEIGKFASHKTAMCDTCKGPNISSKKTEPVKLIVDTSKIDYSKLPSLDDYYILPTIIKNPRLRQVKCPACGREFMKIIKILDWSDYGAIVLYQCVDCYSSVTVSEQPQTLMLPTEHNEYDYSGETIESTLSKLQETQAKHTIRRLLALLDEHNIVVDGIPRPRVMKEIDKIVPRGLDMSGSDEITMAEFIDTLLLLKKVDIKHPKCIRVSSIMLNRLKSYGITNPPSAIFSIPIIVDDTLGKEWRVDYEDSTIGCQDG